MPSPRRRDYRSGKTWESNREEVKYGFARMLFAEAYASYAEENGYHQGWRGDWYYDLEELTGKDDPIPPEAFVAAERGMQLIEEVNGINFETFVPPNDDEYEYIEDAEALGAALALHQIGANADKARTYQLEVPLVEYYWYPDNDEEWYPDEDEYVDHDAEYEKEGHLARAARSLQ